MPKNIRNHTGRIFCFSELSEEAKTMAIQEIINSDEFFFKQKIIETSVTAIKNINKIVNDSHLHKNLINRRNHLSKIQNNKKYLLAYIEENLCQFDENGTYLYYFNELYQGEIK